MFARLLDIAEDREEKRAARLDKSFEGLFPPDRQNIRWKNFRQLGGSEMLEVVRDELFPFMRTRIADRSALGKFRKDANCLIPSGTQVLFEKTNEYQATLESGKVVFRIGTTNSSGWNRTVEFTASFSTGTWYQLVAWIEPGVRIGLTINNATPAVTSLSSGESAYTGGNGIF